MSQDNQEQNNQPSDDPIGKMIDDAKIPPVNANKIQRNHKGWSECRQKPIKALARQMNMPEGFTLGNGDDMYTGEPGDYLFINEVGDKWVVTKGEFGRDFDLVTEDGDSDTQQPIQKKGKSIPDDAFQFKLNRSLDKDMDTIVAELQKTDAKKKQKKGDKGLDIDMYIVVARGGKYNAREQAEFSKLLTMNRMSPNSLFFVSEQRVLNA